jgi:hypothetical protein
MERRAFIAGLLAAPVAAKLPVLPVAESATVVAEVAAPRLTAAIIAQEAIHILNNQMVLGNIVRRGFDG